VFLAKDIDVVSKPLEDALLLSLVVAWCVRGGPSCSGFGDVGQQVAAVVVLLREVQQY